MAKYEDCKHDGSVFPEYTHVVCAECRGIRTDSDKSWGIAASTWFESLAIAEFYKEHGRLPEKVNA